MKMKKLQLILTLILFFLYLSISAQTSLPRSTPEEQGVSSEGILKFLEAAENSKHEFHSIVILRHGKVVAEGWWNPYKPELRHTMYSVSKSFTSTAIGFAVAEKKLTVNDPVISFFPEYLPETVSDNLKALTIKNLLTMSAGQVPDPTPSIRSWDRDWVRSFLATPFPIKPGSEFLYNSVATFMLSAIIQKVTGEKLIDYLKPRLFDPLGITGMDWEVSQFQINTGGWGLRVKTEDLAKFGQFYLQKGIWNGKQLLPKEWVEEATTKKIEQAPNAPQAKKDSSDWMQGYCYKFWRCRNNAYRGDGAYGQFIIMMPEQDAVVAITAESFDLQGEINMVWDYILPAMKNENLAANESMTSKLKQKLASLALPLTPNNSNPKLIDLINEKSYSIETNEKGLTGVSFLIKDDECNVTFTTKTDSYKIAFGLGKWIDGETIKQGPSLITGSRSNFVNAANSKITGSSNWKDENTLELILRYIESPHTEKFIFRFEDDTITLEAQTIYDGKERKTMKGKMLL